jgi:p-hydroxybenzoate 3-monooxygenase
MLALLLHQRGIESVVLEAKSQAYVEKRVRAGVLEQGTVDALRAAGVGARLEREGLIHHGVSLRFGGADHRIAFEDLVPGRTITVYGQQEVVKDLIAARLEHGGDLRFEVSDVRLDAIDSSSPTITFEHEGATERIDCDVVAGCDGFHGVCRDHVPHGALTVFDHEYPFAWLGILAAVAPSTHELIYAQHDRGFSLHSMRSPSISRFYLQVAPDTDLDDWPDDRIWDELATRLETVPGWTLTDGPILERSVTGMRSFVVEPMQHGRLFLAGDAAHIVPPTGAKGMNLAIADVGVLARALDRWYRTGDGAGLDGYTAACLRRVWRVQHFSQWMTSLLHNFADDDPFARRLQRAELEYVFASRAASTTLAENYVGFAWPDG